MLGAGPEGDPGYLGSLGTGTMLAQLRVTFLALAAMPLVVIGLAPAIIKIETGRLTLSPPWATLAVAVLAVLAFWLAPRVPGRLRAGLDPSEAAAASSVSFRSAVLLRFAIAEGVILGGLPLSMASDSLTPVMVAFALGYPLLIVLALPTRATIERMRRRMESGGAQSELWAALLAPYR
jgi:predicted MFS family arabinose efflux permease